jgi:hypothetical protein
MNLIRVMPAKGVYLVYSGHPFVGGLSVLVNTNVGGGILHDYPKTTGACGL